MTDAPTDGRHPNPPNGRLRPPRARYGAWVGDVARPRDRQCSGMRSGLKVGNSRKIKRIENYFGALTFGVLTANEVLQYPNFLGSSSRSIVRLSA